MPYFFLIEGGLGAGKTLIASALAQYFRLKAQRDGVDVKLFSNYDLAFSTPFRSAEQWVDVAGAGGSIVIWDEAQTQFDRRTWTRNTFLTQLFNFTRKMKTVHFFLNPIGNNLDGRILSLVEIFIEVIKFEPRRIVLQLYEYQDKRFGPFGRPIRRLTIPWAKVRALQGLGLYDTNQMLYPFPVPSKAQETDLLQRMIEAQQAALRGAGPEEGGGELSGWINPSDRHADRDRKRKESFETSVFIS